MEQEYGTLLKILGAYLTQRTPKIPDSTNWEMLVTLADVHTVTGIVGHMARRYALCPDENIEKALRNIAMTTTLRFARREERRRELTAAMNRAGIPHVLIKGAVVREYYPVPELRTFGDVDMVIRPEDREKCHTLMQQLGFSPKADWEPVYSYSRPPELYEVHTDLMEVDIGTKEDSRCYFSQMWAYTRPREDGALELTPEFHFLYLMAHIAKHIRGAGAGVRMYLDLAACILRLGETMDWGWIRKGLEKLGLSKFASVALTAVEQWFAVPCPMEKEPVPDGTMEDFLNFTMEAGVYGKYRRDNSLSTLKREENSASGARWRVAGNQIFPPVAQLQRRYTYLNTKPWLLPVAWVHRILRNRNSILRRGVETGKILSADEAEVARLRRIYREIGL